ncbi:MAG: DUF4230 domain-containing protein [Elainella sp.]
MGLKIQSKRNRPDLVGPTSHDLDLRQQLAVSPTPRSLLWFKNLGLLTTGGLTMLGLVTLANLSANLGRTGGQFFSRLGNLFTVQEPPAQVDIRSLVVQQVRNASELTTAVYSMESVVPTSRERTLGGYVIGKTTLLYIAHGEVRAGVDLATLRPEDVQTAVQATGTTLGTGLTLRLPPPKILDSKIDVNRSKVYDYDRGFMGLGPDVAPELQELAQRETLAKIVETACTNGVLQSANDRAKLAVSQLLATAGYADITVEIQPPAADACRLPDVGLEAAPSVSPNTTRNITPDTSPNAAPAPTPSPAAEALPALPTVPLPAPVPPAP